MPAAETPRTQAPAAEGHAHEQPIRRTLIGAVPSREPGWETRLYLIEYAPGVEAPLHVHPSAGVGWVIEGSFESAFGDEPITVVHAGEGFVDKAGVNHTSFRNPDRAHVLRFVVAYTLRTGEEPLRVLP